MSNQATTATVSTPNHSSIPEGWTTDYKGRIYRIGASTREQPGGDLYIRPKTREEMTAPLAWFERQMGKSYRFGFLADGTIGHELVWDGTMGTEFP